MLNWRLIESIEGDPRLSYGSDRHEEASFGEA
jgi:hypothetical protein